MDQDQKLLVTQAICNRFEQAPYVVDKEVLKQEATALISAVNLVNQPDSVTTGFGVAVDVNKGLVEGLKVGPKVAAGVSTSDSGQAGISTGSTKVGLSFNEFVEAIQGGESVILFSRHK